ncbi:DUF4013 domain-containing protein [Methanobrevibacter sp.]
MEIVEIIKDALTYPLSNIKSLVLYVILGIVAGIAGGATLIAIATGAAFENAWAMGGSALIGFILLLLIGLLIEGYTLDIIKYGIERRTDGPGIDVLRQIVNAIKLLVVDIVYYIIPVIILAILGIFFKNWVIGVIGFILTIIFALANFMARCRLAKTEELSDALAIGEAIGDITRVGILKLLLTTILIEAIIVIIFIIIVFIMSYNTTVGGILLGIFGVYAIFFSNRAIGLLYSDA